MPNTDEAELPLWWVGNEQLKLRLGGSFARLLRHLDESVVSAMQGSGDVLRRMSQAGEGRGCTTQQHCPRRIVKMMDPWG